ncbi:tRNA(Glu) U13 pseudouridine synthase TruD [Pseudomonas psychrotolerans]|nr:tRNA(Glu) U13 pseudouridine synthase TruD [Pseudomonas psychrotolerans]
MAAACDETLVILQQGRHRRKLQRGAHAANGFRLRLTGLKADSAALEARLQAIAAQGVPNYFGPQRFGYQGSNLADARDCARDQRLPEQRNRRSRTLSAARSWLFNQVLARRVAEGSWNQVREGDLLAFTDSRSQFPATAADLADPRLAALDLHPTGPLWGKGDSRGSRPGCQP